MKKFLLVTVALLSLNYSAASADYIEPTSEEIREYAFDYMKQFPKKMSEREIANQLASTIYWLEKIQLLCSSYYYVNADAVRRTYIMRQGTWGMMFGVGKTATSILNETSARRNEDFNNTVSKKQWCEGIKAFGIQTFSWDYLFKAD